MENPQNEETKEVSQDIPSFDEIREKVTKLINEVYKARTYMVWAILWPTIPYVSVKAKKLNQRWESINEDEKNGKSQVPSMGVEYTKMWRKERERWESDKQEMFQLISDLGVLYWLDLSDKDDLYVQEENGNIIIGYFEWNKNSGAEIEKNMEDNEATNVRDIINIICNWEKAVYRRNGQKEAELKLKTPEEIKVYKDFNDIYDDLDEEITYTNQSWIDCSISSGKNGYEKWISVVEWENSYNLIVTNKWDFKLIENAEEDDNLEKVSEKLKDIHEKINEWKAINTQNIIKQKVKEYDEAQEEERYLAEQKLDQDLEGLKDIA